MEKDVDGIALLSMLTYTNQEKKIEINQALNKSFSESNLQNERDSRRMFQLE